MYNKRISGEDQPDAPSSNIQKAIIIQLTIGRMTLNELTRFLGIDPQPLTANLEALENTGRVHQPHPGLYALQETADFPSEAFTL